MPRQPKATQAEIVRVLKGWQAAGLKVGRVEIEGGKISVYSSEDVRQEPASKLDAWRASRDPR
ncbi:hypothetical protein [Methylobacterium sp. WL120]|uniref:hypothetical protein n=1 Tax=Methylobacterium sp. WL120 TaxID=2603887 RepID=UPI0011CCC935|nr:hypothetical protein [Methylobacterium sp. WL120]TXM65797.1 hypothetical protein FV229_14555 [Methylobacterium sp. WL120]